MRMAQELSLLFNSTIAFFLALLFVRAALHKLGDRYRFQGILADYGLLPEQTLGLAAAAIPVLELGASVLLILPSMRPVGAALAGILLSAYAIAMAISLLRGRYLIDCGCGGAPEPISWLLVARNGLLTALIVPTAARFAGSATGRLAEDAAALAMAVLLILLWLVAEAVFSNSRRMNEGLPSPVITWSVS